jgi:phage terminase large subunit-like protein
MTRAVEEDVVEPQAGPQRKFAASKADIAIYGGAAGGGKTFALLLEPLYHVAVSGFQAVIFRRTSEQVRTAGGLWDESSQIYPLVGGKGRQHTLDWSWPSGATVRFEQLQHEQTKIEYQGAQICLLCFDELTHFTETQFFYMLSRNRSVCGVKPYVRATTNPDARSWVAKLIEWWIDTDSGMPIQERSGVLRWFVRHEERIEWAHSREELEAKFPDVQPKSLTFVPATLKDNQKLLARDPAYEANLKALPRVERERLLGGNWKASEDAVILETDLVRYGRSGDHYTGSIAGKPFLIHPAQCRRFAVIDTAGTSREKAEEQKGKPASWSVCSIWDYHHAENLLFLVHVWRDRAGWQELKRGIQDTLLDYRTNKAYIENAHHGPALREELTGVQVEMIGPVIEGMTEGHRGAKLERAIACGLLSRIEEHRLLMPADDRRWIGTYRAELTAWGGLPEETADQIDVSSYACHITRRLVSSWGGFVKPGVKRR